MKILFIGPYRQNDGWGHAAKEYLRALLLTGHDIYSRPIYLNYQLNFDELNEFVDLEQKSSPNYDVVIQNCLPNQYRKFGGAKNIGLSFFETSIEHTPWPMQIAMMDQMWVSSSFDIDNAIYCDNHHVIPIPTDITKYTKDFEYNELLKKHRHEYKFYFIGELITRKNIDALITAFHLAFGREENVRLVLKVNRVGLLPAQVLQAMQDLTQRIKTKLGLYKDVSDYTDEIVLPGFLPENDLLGLHKQCDCLVVPSSGEGFCIPALDARGFNNDLLVNQNSSVEQFAYLNKHRVDSHETPAIAEDRPLPFLYNGRDTWFEIDVLDLVHKMKFIYRNREYRPEESPDVSNYSYMSVARKINEALDD